MIGKLRSLIPLHPDRQLRLREIADMDPEKDFERIYRQTVILEFPTEVQTGFQIAFYRPEAVPRMAAVLSGTGHIQANPMTRTYDTGIIVLEIILGGLDSERGIKMITLLHRLHNRPDIHQEDMTYVLNSLMVVPIRQIQRSGWRDLLDVEREAAWRFWSELGHRIGVENLPVSYRVAEAQFDAYELRNLRPSAEGKQLTRLILASFAEWLPRPLRPYAASITSALINDERFSTALGLPPPRRPIIALLSATDHTRMIKERRSPPRRTTRFIPGGPIEGAHPNGYDLDDLGPPTNRPN